MKYRYTILSFIIGKNYELLHEIEQSQNDVEYLMITDDPDLKSDTWKIIYDQDLLQYKTPFERCFRIRYNVFKYCSTDTCITIDGSIQVKGSLDKLIDVFNDGKYDICLMPHPLWPNITTEYNAWIQMRNYPINQANNAMKFFSNISYDFNYKGLFQLCFSIKRKTSFTKKLDNLVFACLEYLSDENNFERLDQTIFTCIMNKFFNNKKVLPVSEQIVRSYALQWYWHKSNKPNMNIFYKENEDDMKYMFNQLVVCYQLIEAGNH